MVVAPPLGAVIPALPDGCSVVYVRGPPYYYYYSVAPSGGYLVVNPPVPAY